MRLHQQPFELFDDFSWLFWLRNDQSSGLSSIFTLPSDKNFEDLWAIEEGRAQAPEAVMSSS
jgi:hypothetical protein